MMAARLRSMTGIMVMTDNRGQNEEGLIGLLCAFASPEGWASP